MVIVQTLEERKWRHKGSLFYMLNVSVSELGYEFIFHQPVHVFCDNRHANKNAVPDLIKMAFQAIKCFEFINYSFISGSGELKGVWQLEQSHFYLTFLL